MEVHRPNFEEVVRIWSLCEFSWSFGLQSRCTGSIYNKIFISESKCLSPSMKAVVRTCACAISLDHLGQIVMFGSHSCSESAWIHVSIFRDISSSSFTRKLFGFAAYLNSLDHLYCSLAVFYNKNLFQEANFSPQQSTQLLELAFVLFLLTNWISDCYVWLT